MPTTELVRDQDERRNEELNNDQGARLNAAESSLGKKQLIDKIKVAAGYEVAGSLILGILTANPWLAVPMLIAGGVWVIADARRKPELQ